MRRMFVMPTFAALIAGCGEPNPPPPPTDPAAILRTLDDLAAFGEKRVGTVEGALAGDYVKARFEAAGLKDVRFETFSFPRHEVTASALAVTIDGVPVDPAPGHDVFEASGSGDADADVVFVGDASAITVDLTGKIALVKRSTLFHRSSQYRNVIAKGAVAMLYVSAAPDNLRQVGSVKSSWEAMGPIPTMSIGAASGQALIDAAGAGKAIRAVLSVTARSVPSTGRNVVGVVRGSAETDGVIVLGAHYDTWFTGSTDNGGGVAVLLALAERRAAALRGRWGVVFVAYDGEEVALYGGYDFLRRHRVVASEPILAVLNFEMPVATGATLSGLGRSNVQALDDILEGAGLRSLYPFYVPMDVLPGLFGGIIPTDIQGIYRAGVPTASTASDSPWYHTVADTPDKVDTAQLARAVDTFDEVFALFQVVMPFAFQVRDRELWQATVEPAPRTTGEPLTVDVTVVDSAGVPRADAGVRVTVFHDDFFLGAEVSATADSLGRARVVVPAGQVDLGAGGRWLHVTAGLAWPLVESVVALP